MSVNELHKRFSFYGENAKKWAKKCALLLPAINKNLIWKKKGFGSIYEYASKIAGMSHSKVDEALWILSKIEDKPDLLKVAKSKGLNAVRPVITMATTKNQKFLAEKAQNMSNNTLRTYIRELKESWDIPEKAKLEMQLSQELLEKINKLKGGKSWENFMRELIELKENSLVKPELKKTQSRHIPAEIKRYVLERSGGICEFPRCNRCYQELHHTQRFALNKEHNPGKIFALCRSHHNLMHQGLVDHEELPPEYWKIRYQQNKFDIKYLVDRQVVKHGASP